ncbi:MAG: hypothetical protein QNL12_12105 [Acidimicrobiia bacterium]|nr:hypothetical protein [Acidimicrobiia bacterium]
MTVEEKTTPRRFPLPSRLDQYEARVCAAYETFRRLSGKQIAVSYAAEWLLDNFYIVQRAIRRIRQDMQKASTGS